MAREILFLTLCHRRLNGHFLLDGVALHVMLRYGILLYLLSSHFLRVLKERFCIDLKMQTDVLQSWHSGLHFQPVMAPVFVVLSSLESMAIKQLL